MNSQGGGGPGGTGGMFRSAQGAHVGMMLKIETNNIWFGSSRYKPVDPVTLTEEGFQIPIRHNDQGNASQMGKKIMYTRSRASSYSVSKQEDESTRSNLIINSYKDFEITRH